MNRKNVWTTYSAAQLKKVDQFAEDYKKFLDESKTEREAIDTIVNEIEAAGYRELNTLIGSKTKLKKGDKVYSVWMNKSIAIFQMGSEPMENGLNILGAHIDSPRLDVKQNPLYEDGGFAYLDTHYYGGIKKYHYVAMPLAIHGVLVKKDGTTVQLNVGEDEDDPVFFVSDLLIHLAQDQLSKKASNVIEGEALDLIIGHRPFVIESKEKEKAEKKDAKLTAGQQYAIAAEKAEKAESGKVSGAVRRGILAILNDLYGIEEEDFISAELEIVPAGKSRDAGFDRSMIMGYGHDDRVCAFPSMRAIMEAKNLKRTACCILVDKEEIGSVGATGMRSRFFENAVAELMALTKEGFNDLSLRRCLANSCMLSSDVSAGFDPSYASCFEKKNASFLGEGLVFNKFTGARGKSGSNDANAEFIAEIRRALDKEGIVYQTAELGKVDVGGGGTIAYILALYGMNVIDAGVAVLNMHAPWEVIDKADLYEALRGYVAFLQNIDFRNE
ncbi:Aspartyl aminopeptidase [Butyrivibrio sp. INlla18]|jgi:aspartyl aminopeptidase|uniref:aminopeptidase n=1 Tax=unclassified Butyrivibrio TaxID=2639466 RepID=UPI0008824BDC|nr:MULTISPECIES: aminopeptidase [unclassified Butyrivibrio]MBE5840994.1 aminopeptidase [Butyrivibrio sp.]MCR4757235.1 aminopeptidase [Butyrivibrio sp.]SDA50584.1 Aspartyl aminopeptidase [Butyrivibrio sp. INlla18]